ncbi:hypothetical protein Syun_014724 [Stephania yunnanensis]|uniref:Uncharacterized protein n=1 Tax=Stephania yunnanensis TaxID=152371 RepID=A0AAP0JKC6_9MAGN
MRSVSIEKINGLNVGILVDIVTPGSACTNITRRDRKISRQKVRIGIRHQNRGEIDEVITRGSNGLNWWRNSSTTGELDWSDDSGISISEPGAVVDAVPFGVDVDSSIIASSVILL